jgi:PIN like domain
VIHGRQRPPCVISSPRTLDRDWIPVVSSHGWLIITRDRRIQDHRLEVASVLDHSARLVALSSAEAGTKWTQLEVVMSRWRDIEALLEQPGPFIYTATRTRLAEVDVESLRKR